MNNGRYRIALSLTGYIEPPPDDHAWELARRLDIYLPQDAEITEIHTSPSTHFIDAVFLVSSEAGPADALQKVQTAIEHLSINVRREHGFSPMGSGPRLRTLTITHAADHSDRKEDRI